ncbi:hypothetical protein PAI11_21440 [Patulibacter medicamentivorans]|uniref:Uncharacterized protein n=1 Tax=Patulibacter medicamentivorans TaxID=1097667 RepID=H0E5P7_9ACTN|nr:hypothetical protein PAI11_21440 [Patulibacter medicamentivorans]
MPRQAPILAAARVSMRHVLPSGAASSPFREAADGSRRSSAGRTAAGLPRSVRRTLRRGDERRLAPA